MDSSTIEKNLSEFRRNVNIIQANGLGQLFGPAHFPSFLGRSLAMMLGGTADDDESLTRFLSEFPTETTLGERKFLFNFFLNFWDGRNDVLEVGPFLGGTSRAIALGMLHSLNKKEGFKLYTYDKFRDYHQPDALLEALAPMFQAGTLDESVRETIKQSSSFKEVFEHLHSNRDYSDLLVAQTGALPDSPGQTVDPEDVFQLPEDRTYSAVFVDGAKSWYGTKAFMCQALNHTSPGAYYIFQDYGAYTCFWIPVFLELLKDHFQLIAFVDHTYAFQQTDSVSAAEVDKVFPDSPQDFSVADFQRIFRNLYEQALEGDNTYTLLNFQLQHAAALAYLGHRNAARDQIVDLLKTPHALRYRRWILQALEVPTYTPEGNITLY
jgi:hypothetical protein